MLNDWIWLEAAIQLNTLDTYPVHHPKPVKLLFLKKKKPPAYAEGFGVSAVNTLGY